MPGLGRPPPSTRKHPHTLLSAGGAADQGVLHLHDKGWPHLCGRGHLRQRGIPCSRHSPGHQVIPLVSRNRDNLPVFSLCCYEIHMEEEGGWMVVSGSFFSNHSTVKLSDWMCFSEKNVQWNRAEAPVTGVGNFVAVNQTHPLFPVFPPEFTCTRKPQKKKKTLSVTPLQYFRSFKWNTFWCHGFLCRTSLKTAPVRGFMKRWSSNISSQPHVCPPVTEQLVNKLYYGNHVLQRVCYHCSGRK